MSGAVGAQKAARALGIKIVAHSHSQPENVFLNMPKFLNFLEPLLYWSWNKFLAWLYSKADVIIYPSEMARELLHHLCEKNKRSEIISNGINTAEFKPIDIGNFYERFSIPRHHFYLVYVGRLYPEKSIQTLIKAMPAVIKKHPNALAVIVGRGYLRPKLEKLAENLGIKNEVKFLGGVDDNDLIKAFNLADIFISPSLAELEGMTVLEAMACGKPIITTSAKMNAARFFVDGNGFLFEPENPADLAERIDTLLSDEKLRTEMAAASLKKSKQYDIHQSVEKLESLYYSLITDATPAN